MLDIWGIQSEINIEETEKSSLPNTEAKSIPEISDEGQTEAVCAQRSEIKPSLADIKKVQEMVITFIRKGIYFG